MSLAEDAVGEQPTAAASSVSVVDLPTPSASQVRLLEAMDGFVESSHSGATTPEATPKDASHNNNSSLGEDHRNSTGHIREVMQRFVAECQTAESDPNWKLATEQKAPKPLFKVWKMFDASTQLHRLRIVGTIPYPLDLTMQILYAVDRRPLWDKTLLENIRHEVMDKGDETDEAGATFDESCVYIAVKCPPGVRNRDFSHRRCTKTEKDGRFTIVDVSVHDERMPVRQKFIRAETVFSGAIVDRVTTNSGEHTSYESITHIDVRGDIPKAVVNAIAAQSTLSWFKTLCTACEKHSKGALVPNSQ